MMRYLQNMSAAFQVSSEFDLYAPSTNARAQATTLAEGLNIIPGMKLPPPS